MSNNQPAQPSPNSEEENPLLFYAVYMPGKGNNRHYLSNGKGGYRLFRSEQAAREYLKPLISEEALEHVVIHPVQGSILVPEPEPQPANGKSEPPKFFKGIPIIPITTLAPESYPSAQELLDDHRKRLIQSASKKPRRK